MLRVIRAFTPTWIVAENVRGLLSIDDGVVFERVCTDLEDAGYEVQPFVIPACAVDAKHRRDRVWIVGYASGDGCNGIHDAGRSEEEPSKSSRQTTFWEPERTSEESIDVGHAACGEDDRRRSRDVAEAKGQGGRGDNAADASGKDVADAEECGLEGKRDERKGGAAGSGKEESVGRSDVQRVGHRARNKEGGVHKEQDVADAEGESERTGLCEKGQGEERGGRSGDECGEEGCHWLPEPAVRELVDGVSDRLVRYEGRVATRIPNRVNKLKALGNSIVPQVAEQIFRAIKKVMEEV